MFRTLKLHTIALTLFALTNACAAPGDVDTSFGSTGEVIFGMGTNNDYASSLVLQSDGKFVLAGSCSNGANLDFCVARLNVDGSLDTTFAPTSSVGAGKLLLQMGAGDDRVSAVALQSDGKIVLAGYCSSTTGAAFCATRLNVNGSVDVSFAPAGSLGAGKFRLSIGARNDFVLALAVQADGKLVLVGACTIPSTDYLSMPNNDYFCAVRLNTDGALDTSFAPTSSLGAGKLLLSVGGQGDYAKAIAVQPDGKLVLAGICFGSGGAFCAVRLNLNGSLDTSFASASSLGAGKLKLPIVNGSDYDTALALQPDGKLVLAGSCDAVGGTDFCALRLNKDGSLDTSFAQTSSVGAGKLLMPIGAGYDSVYALALQPDGKLVLQGLCDGSGSMQFCAARLNRDGALDTTFAPASSLGAGKVLFSINTGNDKIPTLALQPDGKLVLAGSCYNSSYNWDFCLSRYHGGPNTPQILTEYVYNPLQYYFLTSRDAEKTVLDAALGWARTGQSISSLSFADPGSLGISRYYFDQIAKNQTRGSHFYTLVTSEKAALAVLNPANQPLPRLPYNEGIDSYAFRPVIEGVGGSCAAGQTPVYRVFRGQARFPDDPNHRFTTSASLYDQLVAQGWDGEGVKMCVWN